MLKTGGNSKGEKQKSFDDKRNIIDNDARKYVIEEITEYYKAKTRVLQEEIKDIQTNVTASKEEKENDDKIRERVRCQISAIDRSFLNDYCQLVDKHSNADKILKALGDKYIHVREIHEDIRNLKATFDESMDNSGYGIKSILERDEGFIMDHQNLKKSQTPKTNDYEKIPFDLEMEEKALIHELEILTDMVQINEEEIIDIDEITSSGGCKENKDKGSFDVEFKRLLQELEEAENFQKEQYDILSRLKIFKSLQGLVLNNTIRSRKEVLTDLFDQVKNGDISEIKINTAIPKPIVVLLMQFENLQKAYNSMVKESIQVLKEIDQENKKILSIENKIAIQQHHKELNAFRDDRRDNESSLKSYQNFYKRQALMEEYEKRKWQLQTKFPDIKFEDSMKEETLRQMYNKVLSLKQDTKEELCEKKEELERSLVTEIYDPEIKQLEKMLNNYNIEKKQLEEKYLKQKKKNNLHKRVSNVSDLQNNKQSKLNMSGLSDVSRSMDISLSQKSNRKKISDKNTFTLHTDLTSQTETGDAMTTDKESYQMNYSSRSSITKEKLPSKRHINEEHQLGPKVKQPTLEKNFNSGASYKSMPSNLSSPNKSVSSFKSSHSRSTFYNSLISRKGNDQLTSTPKSTTYSGSQLKQKSNLNLSKTPQSVNSYSHNQLQDGITTPTSQRNSSSDSDIESLDNM
uniref:DUF4200 domain-containing protein n=1 Tax=Parastrongyloides trichosuri TaxID=131310 RepID=A0A0N4ZYI7_PARTI